uniref:Securin n=1 Tax=Crocodylus porosus TaxID=8502 RepID=A0A7M4EHC5_CROPO
MATLIFIDQENGEAGATSKDRLRLPSTSGKILSERSQVQTPLVRKTINATPVASKSLRKALGDVNRTLQSTKKKETLKTQKQLVTKSTTEKTTEVGSCNAVPEETYPDIENLFTYNPLDFESFEVPEEHRLSDMSLTGVPLMVFEEKSSDRLVNLVPSPMKLSPISWECAPWQHQLNLMLWMSVFMLELCHTHTRTHPPLVCVCGHGQI